MNSEAVETTAELPSPARSERYDHRVDDAGWGGMANNPEGQASEGAMNLYQPEQDAGLKASAADTAHVDEGVIYDRAPDQRDALQEGTIYEKNSRVSERDIDDAGWESTPGYLASEQDQPTSNSEVAEPVTSENLDLVRARGLVDEAYGEASHPEAVDHAEIRDSSEQSNIAEEPDLKASEIEPLRESIDDAYAASIDVGGEPQRSAGDEFRVKEDLPERLEKAADRSEANDLKTREQAEVFAHDRLGIERPDFSEFDQRTANDVNATIDVLNERYPDIRGLNSVSTIERRNEKILREQPELALEAPEVVAPVDSDTVAVTLRDSGDLSGISINQKWASDAGTNNARMSLDSAAGYSANGVDSIRGVIAHEYGHVVCNQLRADGAYNQIVEPILSDLHSHGNDWVGTHVSRYATATRNELFAELFAEYHNADTPSEHAVKLGKAIDEYFKKR